MKLFASSQDPTNNPFTQFLLNSISNYTQNIPYENVVSHDRMKSRIILQLKDDTLVDADKLKGIGVDSIIKMSNKTILVVEQDPEAFYSLFN